MGNKISAAGPNETTGGMSLSPPPLHPPPASSQSSTETPKPTEQTAADNNPGTFEELHRKCKDIFPQCFEGGKFIFSKGLSSHFQVSHTINLSTVNPASSGYRFGATYVGSKQLGPQEMFPVVLGDMDASGNLNANIIHAFSQNIRTKLVTQIQDNKCVATQAGIDYRGSDYTASLTLGNLDVVNMSGILVTQYLQKVTSRLSIGAELVYQYGPQVPGGEFTALSVASKLTGDKWTLSGNISPLVGGAHLCYHHKVTEELDVGAEIETSLAQGESVCKLAYQLEVPEASITFRGSVDTNWGIEATLERKLLPFPFTFALSGMASLANFQKPQYRYGIGLIIGS